MVRWAGAKWKAFTPSWKTNTVQVSSTLGKWDKHGKGHIKGVRDKWWIRREMRHLCSVCSTEPVERIKCERKASEKWYTVVASVVWRDIRLKEERKAASYLSVWTEVLVEMLSMLLTEWSRGRTWALSLSNTSSCSHKYKVQVWGQSYKSR